MSLLTDALFKSSPEPDETAESAITKLEEKLDISGELDESSRDPTVQTVALDELLLEEFEAARRDRDLDEEQPEVETSFDSSETDVLSHDEVLAAQSIVLEDLPDGALDAPPDELALLHEPPVLTDTDDPRDPTMVIMPDPEVLTTKPRRRPRKHVAFGVVAAAVVSSVAFYFLSDFSDEQMIDNAFENELPTLAEPTSLSSLAPEKNLESEVKPLQPTPPAAIAAEAKTLDETPNDSPTRSSFAREPATVDDVRSFAARAAKAQPAPEQAIKISRTNRKSPVYLALTEAYALFKQGNLSEAGTHYQKALSLDPNNVDALLGLAALAQRDGKLTEAQNFYRMALNLDPKNSIALSGMMALQKTAATVENESELKSMLVEQPQAAHVHFALGVHYVSQSRWPDAQQSFFEAARHDPTNADYAYNLAVSLDQLGQRDAAASYYERAIDLSNGVQKFDLDVARKRLSTLTASN